MRPNDLLRYWRDQEFFRLFDFDQVLEERRNVVPLRRGDDVSNLPWDEDSELDPEYEYAFDFFVAPFWVQAALRYASRAIAGASREIPEYIDPGTPLRSCVGRLLIDHTGSILWSETSLSTFPWAVHQVVSGVALSLASFDGYASDLIETLLSSDKPRADCFPSHADLQGLADLMAKLSPAEMFDPELIGAIVPIRLRKRRDKPAEAASSATDEEVVAIQARRKRKVDILNSFFLRDLARVESSKVSPSSALGRFFEGAAKPSSERIDIRSDPARYRVFVDASCEPAMRGLWPDGAMRAPSEQQALALRLFLCPGPAQQPALVAVNGPPGTGKTALVKDALAELAVQKAFALSKLRSPQSAFEKQLHTFEISRSKTLRYRRLIPPLRGFGLLIASSNNAAVENITRGLPDKDSIDEGTFAPSFLGPPARRYERWLKRALDDETFEPTWWGLPTIALGKRANRVLFTESVLATPFGEKSDTAEARKAAGELSIEEWRNAADLQAQSFSQAKKSFRSLWEAEDRTAGGRKALFTSALALIEAWVREVPALDRELAAVRAMLRSPQQIPPQHAAALWDVLFAVVPAVSTTLASVERMLATVSPETFGYAVVEEAGQALPQSVVGILFRSRRVLMIGDQRQLEPISSTPQALLPYLRVDDETDAFPSAQSFADEQSVLGTYLGDVRERVWVGLPLLEHRRCDEPMFSISNELAYDGMMRQCTPDRAAVVSAGESCWFDVKGKAVSTHWVPEQGAVVASLVTEILEQAPLSDLFVISPFRAVRAGLLTKLAPVAARFRSAGFSFAGRVGTVHAFQGKEADIVFLVLGCDLSTPGAADWAGSQVNLLNVAVTRAKRRLYVVGDIDVWHRRGYFSDLVRKLPVRKR